MLRGDHMKVSVKWHVAATLLGTAVVTGAIGPVGGLWGRLVGSVTHAQEAASLALDGVFTEGQAERGGALYGEQGVVCHGEKLEGGISPGLTGDDFMKYWTTKSVGEMVEQMMMTMPADDPGKLTPAEAADLAAFILSKNKLPAGQKELATDVAALKQIRIVKSE